MRARDAMLVAVVGAVAGTAATEVMRSAFAAGVPATDPLVYSG